MYAKLLTTNYVVLQRLETKNHIYWDILLQLMEIVKSRVDCRCSWFVAGGIERVDDLVLLSAEPRWLTTATYSEACMCADR